MVFSTYVEVFLGRFLLTWANTHVFSTHVEVCRHNIDKIAPFDQRFSVNPHVRLT